MNKKQCSYKAPSLRIVTFEPNDIVTTSGDNLISDYDWGSVVFAG